MSGFYLNGESYRIHERKDGNLGSAWLRSVDLEAYLGAGDFQEINND
jgi:hypothetical protein